MQFLQMDIRIGRNAKRMIAESRVSGFSGALAALELFYHGFNARLPEILASAWHCDDLIQLNNPLGGIMRGPESINQLYQGVLNGRARVWVEFFDVVAYSSDHVVVFAGSERGECEAKGETLQLQIRTSRIFAFEEGGGWKQVHHHGSIDDPELLKKYQQFVGRAGAERSLDQGVNE
jgi:ketosteroid isomerase-like protein